MRAKEFRWVKRTKRLRSRERRQQIMDKILKKLTKNVDVVFVGTAACQARGHHPTPIKKLTHTFSKYVNTIPISEFGTSSRCPKCKSKTKMKSIKYEDLNDDEKKQLEVEEPNTSLQNSRCIVQEQQLSFNTKFIKSQTSDVRYERCTNSSCKKIWLHDRVSCICMGDIGKNILVGEKREAYLCR